MMARLSPEVLAMMRGCCPLCNRVTDLVQDHDHETGLCRDAICSSCNQDVGRFEWPSDHIRKLIDYVESWRRRHAAGEGYPYPQPQKVVPRRKVEGRD